MKDIFLHLDRITLRVRDRHILKNFSWTIRKGEHWAVIGPNGSGKTTLTRAIVDEYLIVKGTTFRHESLSNDNATGYVSFEQQQDLHDYSELKGHAFSFSGKPQDGITGLYVITADLSFDRNYAPVTESTDLLGITDLLDRNMRTLSNGEVRKVLIARALVKKPVLLVLDEPFEGLDYESCRVLEEAIDRIISHGKTRVILATHRFEHLSRSISHLLCLKDCNFYAAGKKEEVLSSSLFKELFAKNYSHISAPRIHRSPSKQKNILLSMKNVNVNFDGERVIDGFSWEIREGENWILSGPNGAGKSTILRLIFGDLPQVYANDISIFGYPRGAGESLWDIRKDIGYLSPEFHMEYRKNVPLLDTVLSGFYDSVGLFRTPSATQISVAENWIDLLGFSKRKEEPVHHFSFGEQRLILLIRAIVKRPKLLILDEPLQGLDPENRTFAGRTIEQAACTGESSVIYITHHNSEILSFFTHRMEIHRHGGTFHFLASTINYQ